MKVLITGGSGILGTALRALPHEKVFYDRTDASPLLEGETYFKGDIRDRDLLKEAMTGCQAVIHCAGSMGSQDQWDESFQAIMLDNIEGLMATFDTAKAIGVEKIIFASSNHAVGMFEVENAPRIYEFDHGILIDENVPLRPDSFYGVSKVFGESYGRFLAENGGPKCYVLRIGSVRSEQEDHPYAYAEWGVRKGKWKRGSREYAVQEQRLKALWMSRRDFVQLTERALEYDGPVFDVFNAVSDNDRKWFDLSHPQTKLGYQPKDNSEGWVQIMTEWSRETGAPIASATAPPKMAVMIPVRVDQGDDINFISRLIDRTAQCARECKMVDRIILATDSAELASRAGSLGVEVPFLRSPEFSAAHVRADAVLKHMLEQLEEEGYLPDLIAPLEITHPFRPANLLKNLVQKLFAERLNTVIAGYPERRPCWIRRQSGVIRIDEYSKLRDVREPIHIGLPSLGCVTFAEFLRKGSRFGTRIGVLEIDDQLAAIEVRDYKSDSIFQSLDFSRRNAESNTIFNMLDAVREQT